MIGYVVNDAEGEKLLVLLLLINCASSVSPNPQRRFRRFSDLTHYRQSSRDSLRSSQGKTAGQTKLTQGQMMQLKLSAYKDAATEVASPRTPRVPASTPMPMPMPTPRTEFNPSPRRRTSFKDMKNVQKKLEKKMLSDRKKGVRLTINRTQNMGTGNGDTMF